MFIPLKTDETWIEIHDSIDSTNTLAKKRAIEGVGDCYTVVAESQSMGRGRNGRSWHSPPAVNLYLSMVLNINQAAAGIATLMGAVAVMNSVKQLCPRPELVQIKWPNDVLIDGKKIAGVLGEFLSERPDCCVLGIGMNVNANISDLPDSPRWPATSLSIHLGGDLDRNTLLSSLLSELRSLRGTLESDRDSILEQVRKNSATIGRTVVLDSQNSGTIKCKAIGIDKDGFLLLQGPEGKMTVVAGDVDIVQDNGYY